ADRHRHEVVAGAREDRTATATRAAAAAATTAPTSAASRRLQPDERVDLEHVGRLRGATATAPAAAATTRLTLTGARAERLPHRERVVAVHGTASATTASAGDRST